jgi:hypothetical protein
MVAVVIGATLAAPTIATGEVVLRRDGSKAVEGPPLPPIPVSAEDADGFQLDDAGIGAAGMFVLALMTAGTISLRGRRSRTIETGRATRSPDPS